MRSAHLCTYAQAWKKSSVCTHPVSDRCTAFQIHAAPSANTCTLAIQVTPKRRKRDRQLLRNSFAVARASPPSRFRRVLESPLFLTGLAVVAVLASALLIGYYDSASQS